MTSRTPQTARAQARPVQRRRKRPAAAKKAAGTTDGMRDLGEDEINPSFATLLKRAGELKKGDDDALRQLAGEAAAMGLSTARLDMLARQAAKASGFVVAIVRAAFDRALAERQAQQQAERQAQERADPAVAAAAAAALKAAQDAERAARAAERERLKGQCEKLAKAPDLFERMEKAAHRLGVVGEGAATRGAYIAATSRLLRDGAVNLLRRGAPAGGKNYLFTNVTVLMPAESVITVSGASPTALIYYGDDEDALKHKIIVIAEAAAIAARSNGDEHPLTILLRTLLSEGRIDRYVAIPQQISLPRSVHVRRNGPVALMLTSARENIDAEMLTRLMISDTDETAGQTKAIVKRKLGREEKLAPLAEEELERWRDLQRWLEFDAPYDVEVPFQGAICDAWLELIERSPRALQLRMRRDVSGLLAAIKTSAVIHKAQRAINGDGRVIAKFADYENAWQAFDAGMASLYGLRAREEIIAVVEAAERLGVLYYAGDPPPMSVKLTSPMVRKELGIGSYETAANRIREAVEHGALKEDDARRGSGRGRPRYFWISKSSGDLRKAPQGGVFPSPDDVKKKLEGERGAKTAVNDVRDVIDDGRMAPDRTSLTSVTSFTADSAPLSPPDISFGGAATQGATGETAPLSGKPDNRRRSPLPEGRALSAEERVAAAEGLGLEFVLDEPGPGFSWIYAVGVDWRDPMLRHAEAAINASRSAVEAVLRRRQAQGG